MFSSIIALDTPVKPVGWGTTLAEEKTWAQRGTVTCSGSHSSWVVGPSFESHLLSENSALLLTYILGL